MKQQLQEKEELIKTLQTQLSQTQAEQAAQVGDGAFIRIKDHRVQSGVCGKYQHSLKSLVEDSMVARILKPSLGGWGRRS